MEGTEGRCISLGSKKECSTEGGKGTSRGKGKSGGSAVLVTFQSDFATALWDLWGTHRRGTPDGKNAHD